MSGQAQRAGFVLAATGLRAEARIAARVPQVRAVAGGGDSGRLERLLRREIAESAKAIVSLGIAAGLAPAKRPGTCVVAREIAHADIRYPTDQAWAERLRTVIPDTELATIAGVDRPLQSPAEKHALYAATGAVAADMESHIAAAYAAEAGLPFAALRVISDPAGRALPALAKSAIKPNGDIDVRKVLRGLARNPRTLRALVSTGIDFNRALRSLRGCRGFLIGGETLVAAEI